MHYHHELVKKRFKNKILEKSCCFLLFKLYLHISRIGGSHEEYPAEKKYVDEMSYIQLTRFMFILS